MKLWRPNLHFQNIFILRTPRVVTFAGIIKIATMFIKTTFKDSSKVNFAGIIKIVTMFIKITLKDSSKVKRILNYVLKCNLYLYFLI